MGRGRIQRQQGFSLIEVLVAVALYAVALISLFGMLIASVTAGTIGESSAVAVNLARQRLEALTARDVQTIIAEDCVPPGSTSQHQVPAGRGIVYTLTVACATQPAYLDVSVTARWRVQGNHTTGGTQYSRVLSTRLAR